MLTNIKLITMTTWINNKLVEIKYNKLDYWTMYVDGDLSLEELLKLIKEK